MYTPKRDNEHPGPFHIGHWNKTTSLCTYTRYYYVFCVCYKCTGVNSFFESWVWPPLLLGEFTFLCFCLGFQSSHLGSVRTTHFTFLLVCVVIVFITQVIPKVFFNYIIIQSLLFTSLKLREYFLSDNLH